MKTSRSLNHVRWLTISDIAELLQVSERTVRRWIDVEDLATHKLGRQWRISGQDLQEFLQSHRQGGQHYVL